MTTKPSFLLTLSHTRTREILEFYPSGHLIRRILAGRVSASQGKLQSKRGPITKFSRKAGKRLRERVLRVNRDEPFLHVVLTYGAIYPHRVDQAKKHLSRLWRLLHARFAEVGAIWAMQFQQRGAPHFHLVVWGVSARALRSWIKEAWHSVATDDWSFVDSCGARVEQGRSLKAIANYLSSPYGVPESYLKEGLEVGRLWGVKGQSNIPDSPRELFQVKPGHEAQVERLFRRYIKAQNRGRPWRGMPRSVQVQDPVQWARCLERQGHVDVVGRQRETGMPSEDHSAVAQSSTSLNHRRSLLT